MPFLPDISDKIRFDSELRTSMVDSQTNAELTLSLRVFLRRVTVKATRGKIQDANGLDWYILDWQEMEYRDFCKDYQNIGQGFWDGKYCLRTPDRYSEFDWPNPPLTPTHRPNVYCKFKLQVVNSAANAHTVIDLVRLNLEFESLKYRQFRSHSTMYNNFDVRKLTHEGVPDEHGKRPKYEQVPIVHEIGHSLGLLDMGKLIGNIACGADRSTEGSCYGFGMKPDVAANVMGAGMKLTAIDAKPWLTRIADHTKTPASDWKVLMKQRQEHWPPHPRLLKTIKKRAHAG